MVLTIKGREGEGGDDGGVGFLEKKMDTAHTQGRGETQMAHRREKNYILKRKDRDEIEWPSFDLYNQMK